MCKSVKTTLCPRNIYIFAFIGYNNDVLQTGYSFLLLLLVLNEINTDKQTFAEGEQSTGFSVGP